MQYRATRSLSVSTLVLLLATATARPPDWAVRDPGGPSRQTISSTSMPKMVAIDRRIAKRVNALRPCVKQRLTRVAERLPQRVTLLVTSAFRTYQEQRSLRSTYGVKARPGRSAHEDGRAIDVNVLVDGERIDPRRQQAIIGAEMASEGFEYFGRRDPVHYSLPKESINLELTSGPNLQLITWSELEDLRRETVVATASQQPSFVEATVTDGS